MKLYKTPCYDQVNLLFKKLHVTISTNGSIEEIVEKDSSYIRYRKAYGICGKCNEPGTGQHWCQNCNSKRFKDNFKNWTNGNNDIDEFIQQSQLNSVYYTRYLDENFRYYLY
jgi:hypothetical protein